MGFCEAVAYFILICSLFSSLQQLTCPKNAELFLMRTWICCCRLISPFFSFIARFMQLAPPPSWPPPGCRLPEEEKNLKMSVLIDTAAEDQQIPACKPKEEGSISNTTTSTSSWNGKFQHGFCHAGRRSGFVPFQSQMSALPFAPKKS